MQYTALMLAAKLGHRSIVRYLLEHGASPNSASHDEEVGKINSRNIREMARLGNAHIGTRKADLCATA